MTTDFLIIRAAALSDSDDVANLTPLDARGSRAGRGLVAELNGATVAAISLTTGAVAAATDQVGPDAVRSLRRRRYQILRQGADVGAAHMLLRRLAP